MHWFKNAQVRSSVCWCRRSLGKCGTKISNYYYYIFVIRFWWEQTEVFWFKDAVANDDDDVAVCPNSPKYKQKWVDGRLFLMLHLMCIHRIHTNSMSMPLRRCSLSSAYCTYFVIEASHASTSSPQRSSALSQQNRKSFGVYVPCAWCVYIAPDWTVFDCLYTHRRHERVAKNEIR